MAGNGFFVAACARKEVRISNPFTGDAWKKGKSFSCQADRKEGVSYCGC